MAGRRRKPHGVFCLEGEWLHSLKRAMSVEPILALLEQLEDYRVPYIHRDVGTAEELTYYLRKWIQKRHADHPILYLAFHGEKGALLVGDGRTSTGTRTLDILEDELQGSCTRRVIFFAGCNTVDLHGHRLNRFLSSTGALAVCGYTKSVDWLKSAAFELFLLGAIQRNALTTAGMRSVMNRIKREVPVLAKDLGFRTVIKK
jgi:hypothetical protein